MTRRFFVVAALAMCAACSDNSSVDSNEQARRAYLGLDTAVGKSLGLGFDGFNMASSANIAPQTANGIEKGTLTVTGQVDQGQSANKGMRLFVALTAYSDGPFEVDTKHDKIDVVYDTDSAALPALDLQLKGIPTGTLAGTLTGTFKLSGALQGTVMLDLTISGHLADGGNGTVIRAPGTTTITGTAVQGSGMYEVNVTL